jgi:hypothetical protein
VALKDCIKREATPEDISLKARLCLMDILKPGNPRIPINNERLTPDL